jgi:hypothetical protein
MHESLDRCNVVWDSPSRPGDVSGSMPIGNGDIGLNVWVEAGGDLLFLIGKTDTWDENSINLKLGRIRLAFQPNPFAAGTPFRQTLNLRKGEIEIVAAGTTIRLWVDANRPVIHVETESEHPLELMAALETWRTEPYPIKTQTSDLFKRLGAPDPHPTIISPDQVLADAAHRVVWCHHNERRDPDGYAVNMRLQGLGSFLSQMPHPLLGRTFGAAMEGEGLESVDPLKLKSTTPRRNHRVSISLLTLHPATVDQWRQRLDEVIATATAVDRAVARREHERWWEAFWQRSWLFVHGDEAFHVTQGYVLQRFLNAAGGRGAQPIKYNGSIFSVGKPDDPDFRRWGGPGFWFMNQRLIYWPMLAGGDFDLLQPWFRMYLEMLPLQRQRTQTFFGHGGAHYPETITFWGAEVSAHYGWTPFEQRARPEAECPYVTYYWTGGLELTLILWTCYAQTLDDRFARDVLLPIADDVTAFFDLHYPRDAGGKLHLHPAQALETWQDATNPTPDIAGLRYILEKLVELPERLTTDSQRERWSRLLPELPSIPIGEKDGRRVILPAERFDRLKNTENPELYCVFPFRLFGVAKDGLQLARDTFALRLHASHTCWSQDDVQMACLGLAEEAKDNVIRRASPASHSDSRFPAFWNAHHDWVPDMDHGGVLQLTLQNMLMQCEGRQILLLPAWPKEWDADFKLHAPYQTVVEGKVRNGRISDLRVTPESRRGDIVVIESDA